MGLAEHISAGAKLDRQRISFTTDATGIGSASIAKTYALLEIQASAPCRIRLYDNSQSRDDANEIARSFGNTSVSSSVALIGDFTMSQAGANTVDPVLYSMTSDMYTYYRVEPAAVTTIGMRIYKLEDSAITATVGTPYAVANRRQLPYITASLSAGQLHSGSIADSQIPQTYLLISASVSSSVYTRLRLYSTTGSLYDSAEKARPFSTEPSASSYLIADMLLTSSQATFFTPKIIGANLQNMTPSLATMRGVSSLITGKNELYYILENAESAGGAASISASIYVYSLED